MERAATISIPGTEPLFLEALYISSHSPDGAVVAPPHPLMGGSMDHPVVSEVAFALERVGISSLRFNWRGVGASTGVPSGDLDEGLADYEAALTHLGETVAGGLVACGYSFGALAAQRAAARNARIDRMVLVAPPTRALAARRVEEFAGRVLIVAGEVDPYAPVSDVRELANSWEESTLIVIPAADHFFGAGLAEIGKAVREWAERRA